MMTFRKEASLEEGNIPFGYVEVRYPSRKQLRVFEFYELVEQELAKLREQFLEYDRKTVFGNNPYF